MTVVESQDPVACCCLDMYPPVSPSAVQFGQYVLTRFNHVSSCILCNVIGLVHGSCRPVWVKNIQATMPREQAVA